MAVMTSNIELKSISKLKDGYFKINFENDSFKNQTSYRVSCWELTYGQLPVPFSSVPNNLNALH